MDNTIFQILENFMAHSLIKSRVNQQDALYDLHKGSSPLTSKPIKYTLENGYKFIGVSISQEIRETNDFYGNVTIGIIVKPGEKIAVDICESNIKKDCYVDFNSAIESGSFSKRYNTVGYTGREITHAAISVTGILEPEQCSIIDIICK